MTTDRYPSIDCLCPTYGRPPAVLGEAVESFLRQDYKGFARLLIVNDLPEQTLKIEPRRRLPQNREIHVLNRIEREPTLGAKFRLCHDASCFHLRAVWEDDDIYLPHRLSYSVEHRQDNGCYHTPTAWFERMPGFLHPASNLHHCNLLMTRDAYQSAGGYRAEDTAALDQYLIGQLRQTAGLASPPIPWADAFYIYRWQYSGSWHGSGLRTDGMSLMDAAAAQVETAIIQGIVSLGEVVIRPRWSRDWTELARQATQRTAEQERQG